MNERRLMCAPLSLRISPYHTDAGNTSLCITANLGGQCLLWVIRVAPLAPTALRHVRCTPNSSRIARRHAALSRAARSCSAHSGRWTGAPAESDQKTLGQATRTAVQAEREPSSLMARNIRLPASTLEDRGQT
jgi:hypothetical protein